MPGTLEHQLGLHVVENYSFYAVPAAFLTAFAPHVFAIMLVNNKRSGGGKGFNLSFPKKTRESISECQLSPTDQERFQRAEAANDNGFVALPLFAAAIVAGNVAKLPNKTLNNVAALYVGSRVAFNLLYIFGTTNAAGIGRSVAWLAGMGGCLSLFVQAGKAFQKAIM